MKISAFNYNLPKQLIAKYPPKKRGTSNLLVLDKESGDIQHKKYYNIPHYIQKGDIVVLNETKVLQSRTYFLTPKDKKVEVLFLEERNNTWYCLLGRAKDVNISDILKCNDISIKVVEREGSGFLVSFVNGNALSLFEKYGHTPLPPYMKREDEKADKERYNTVFSSLPGAVAAPTASLNITQEILQEIEKKGARIVKIELKVGWGTFEPIREEEDIERHNIHEEYINVSEQVADDINKCSGRVWAFGTTVARTLESVYSEKQNKILPYSGSTNLYIYPGYKWKVVDILVTNFHMPDSSLILLVSSFAGKDNIQKAYAQAISKKYKFLSYGDSMLIGSNLSK